MGTKPQTMSGSSLCWTPSRLVKSMAQWYPCRLSGATRFGEAGNAEDRSRVQAASADRAGYQGVPERGGVDALAAVQE